MPNPLPHHHMVTLVFTYCYSHSNISYLHFQIYSNLYNHFTKLENIMSCYGKKKHILYSQYSLCTVVQDHKNDPASWNQQSKAILVIEGEKITIVLWSLKFLSKHLKPFKTVSYKYLGKWKYCVTYFTILSFKIQLKNK